MIRLVRSAELTPDDLIYPIFVREDGQSFEIPSIRGQKYLSLDDAVRKCHDTVELGVPSVLVFGVLKEKDADGSIALRKDGFHAKIFRTLKRELCDELVLISNVCLCGKSPDSLVSFLRYVQFQAKERDSRHNLSITSIPISKFLEKDKVQIFLAVYDGQPVAGVFVVIHGDTAYALGAGSREEVWSVRPYDLLHWEALKWACGEGLSWYHMGYVSEPPPAENSLGWGLWRWKREWNGQLEKVYVCQSLHAAS
jgi:hypothetical protein